MMHEWMNDAPLIAAAADLSDGTDTDRRGDVDVDRQLVSRGE
jgi:hypothetical protein